MNPAMPEEVEHHSIIIHHSVCNSSRHMKTCSVILKIVAGM